MTEKKPNLKVNSTKEALAIRTAQQKSQTDGTDPSKGEKTEAKTVDQTVSNSKLDKEKNANPSSESPSVAVATDAKANSGATPDESEKSSKTEETDGTKVKETPEGNNSKVKESNETESSDSNNEPGDGKKVNEKEDALDSEDKSEITEEKTKVDVGEEQVVEPTSPPKKIKPVWKELEPPPELKDRVKHILKDAENYEKWGIVAASLRGKSHAHKRSFREDSYKYDQEGPWTIIAVGDGAGSAKLSRVGSRAACDTAVEKIKQLLKGYVLGTEKNAERPSETELSRLKAFLVLAASEAKNALVNKCHEKKCQFDDLSTTLLLVIHCEWNSKNLLASLQVGDGAVGIFADEKQVCTLLGDADHGAHASETVFLTSMRKLSEKPFDQRVQFSIKDDLKCVAVMSDGVSDDFFPEKDRLVELFNGDPISVKGLVTANEEPVKGVIHDVLKNPDGGNSLVDWLGYEKRGSFDDRTLVLFYRKIA